MCFVGNTTQPPALPDLPRTTADPAEAGVPLKINGEQTIQTSDALQQALAEYLERGLPVVLDLSDVHTCDTALLQLIYAMRRSAVQRERAFHVTGLSPAVTATAAALGLCIEDWMTAGRPPQPSSRCGDAGIDHGI